MNKIVLILDPLNLDDKNLIHAQKVFGEDCFSTPLDTLNLDVSSSFDSIRFHEMVKKTKEEKIQASLQIHISDLNLTVKATNILNIINH